MRLDYLKILILTFLTLAGSNAGMAGTAATDELILGRLLFNDKNLSRNRNQACASCHGLSPVSSNRNVTTSFVPGFVDPGNVKQGNAVSPGSIASKSGILNAPSIGYSAYSPLFHWDHEEGLYVGGQFWNGRARNLAEQAKAPFLNPIEMAMPSQWAVVSRVQVNPLYHRLFLSAFGLNLAAVPKMPGSAAVKPKAPEIVAKVFQHMAKAISIFEQSRLFNKFNSKFDYVLAGKTLFTPIEMKGFKLFNDENKGNCAACHISKAERDESGSIIPPLFTDFTYDNIGLPRNVMIPGNPNPNLGLGGRPDIARIDAGRVEMGKHKVMSLRNIAITPPYGHNGVFSTLEQITHFYNTRDTIGWVPDNRSPGFGKTGWPKPEVPRNVNRSELGNLGLSAAEEQAIVAFMLTLTDDYPKWGKDPRVPPGTPSPFANGVKVPKF
jgi:cytochrome c peroxidase